MAGARASLESTERSVILPQNSDFKNFCIITFYHRCHRLCIYMQKKKKTAVKIFGHTRPPDANSKIQKRTGGFHAQVACGHLR
jgi:hypothetical protein